MYKRLLQILCLSISVGTIYIGGLNRPVEDRKTDVKEIVDTMVIERPEPVEIKIQTFSMSEIIGYELYTPNENDISEEIRTGEMELLAQLVQAEAGNQDLTGMRYVADVVLNRVDNPRFPDTVEEVIFQENQFSVIGNGSFDVAAWNISENAFKAVELEWDSRLDSSILSFNNSLDGLAGKNEWKYGDHWFGY